MEMYNNDYARLVGEDNYFSGPFSNQLIPAYVGSSTGVSYITHEGWELGVAPLPGNTEKAANTAGTNIVMFSKDENQQKAAWEYLKFCVAPVEEAAYYSIYQPEGSVDIAYGSFPVAKQNLAAYGEVYAKAAVYQKSHENIEGFDPTTMDSAVPEGLLSQLEQVFSSYTLGDTLGRVGDILLPVMQQYYDTDTLSAQECAGELQGKVEIWLSE